MREQRIVKWIKYKKKETHKAADPDGTISDVNEL